MKFNSETAKPREVEAYLRDQILKIFGDAAENDADIWSTRGYYNVEFSLPDGQQAAFKNFRKQGVAKVVKAMRTLK